MVTPSSASDNLIRRSSLKNPVSVATTTTTTSTSSGSGSSPRSISSPTRSHASILASTSTLSSKAPAFEPTGSISKLTFGGGGIIPIANAAPKPKPNPSTSPVLSKGKEAAVNSKASAVPTPIQKPVGRTSSLSGGGGGGGGRRRHTQWNYSGGF